MRGDSQVRFCRGTFLPDHKKILFRPKFEKFGTKEGKTKKRKRKEID